MRRKGISVFLLDVLFLPLFLTQNLPAKEKHTEDVGWDERSETQQSPG